MNISNPNPITLYHGTSELFLPYIREYGLGAQNILEKWRFYDLVKELAPLCEGHTEDFDDYSFGRMVEQSTENSNFQHGHVYLSPSRGTAARYAASNAYGSELISEAMARIKHLDSLKIEGIAELMAKYPEANRLKEQSFKPILISISDASRFLLATEHGRDATSSIADLRSTLEHEPEMLEIIHQQTNFRLIEAVRFNELSIQRVDVKGWSWGFPSFEIVPWSDGALEEGA